MTLPMNASGVTTSALIMGSSSTAWALGRASLKAMEAAILKAISEESTSWDLPS